MERLTMDTALAAMIEANGPETRVVSESDDFGPEGYDGTLGDLAQAMRSAFPDEPGEVRFALARRATELRDAAGNVVLQVR